MPTTKQHLINRENAIKALNEFKSTHSLEEIAVKTSIPFSRLKHCFYERKDKLDPSIRVYERRISNEAKQKIIDLVKQGFSVRKAAIETNTSYSAAFNIIAKTKSTTKENKKNIETVLLHQYRDANFDVTPLFLIKTHNVTPATAARICEKLKGVK